MSGYIIEVIGNEKNNWKFLQKVTGKLWKKKIDIKKKITWLFWYFRSTLHEKLMPK